ncbi:hypothetical protein K443DRAFT_96136, partial [Laccaria amethystina LaAM-08-1]
LLCRKKGQKRREVCALAFKRYSAFSVLVGGYSRMKGQKRGEVCVHVFQRYSAFSVLYEGPKETWGVCFCIPEILHIFCFDGYPKSLTNLGNWSCDHFPEP